ncbi:MAG: phosphonate metabolism transcriptional regulator PhnF [Pseudomonadota bacterium]|nr:phosphonate metabolism transcriptional regulator PhnF [Pseudomonadota bacterium]
MTVGAEGGAPPELETQGTRAEDGAAEGAGAFPDAGLAGADSGLPLWARIRDVLAEEIRARRWATGERMPSETALATRFGVNRHTLRRAMAALSEAGMVHVRRGAGAVVTHAATDYPISRRPRFTASLRAAGRTPERRFLRLETAAPSKAEAEILALRRDGRVHITEALNTVDGAPVAYSRSVYPAEPLPRFLDALRETGSITRALAMGGVPDYTRLWTRMTAQRAGAMIAHHLMAPEATPLLRAESLSADGAGRPVEYGLTWFFTDRMPILVSEPPEGHDGR